MYENPQLNHFVESMLRAGLEPYHMTLGDWQGPAVTVTGDVDGYDQRNLVVEHCDLLLVRDELVDNKFRFRPVTGGELLAETEEETTDVDDDDQAGAADPDEPGLRPRRWWSRR